MAKKTAKKAAAKRVVKKVVASKESAAAYLEALVHPLKRELVVAREIILGAAPGITESVKWNSLNFRAGDDFATFHGREEKRLVFIFHTGAKAKASAKTGVPIPEAVERSGMVKWLAKDRAMVTLGAGDEIEGHRKTLAALVAAWVKAV